MAALTNASEDRRFYVYTLSDSHTGEVFYVGKGTGKRMYAHEAEYRRGVVKNAEKHARIAEIIEAGGRVIATKVQTELTEAEAFQGERRLIGKLGFSALSNVVPGQYTGIEKSKLRAAVSLSQLKDRDHWLSEEPRTQMQISLFDRIKLALEDIAQNGCPSEIIISANSVSFR